MCTLKKIKYRDIIKLCMSMFTVKRFMDYLYKQKQNKMIKIRNISKYIYVI